jgi:hypothetical protein
VQSLRLDEVAFADGRRRQPSPKHLFASRPRLQRRPHPAKTSPRPPKPPPHSTAKPCKNVSPNAPKSKSAPAVITSTTAKSPRKIGDISITKTSSHALPPPY